MKIRNMTPGQRVIFSPTATTLRYLTGTPVTIERPLTAEEADLYETGPMFRVRDDSGTPYDAFLDELVPI